MAKAPKPKPQEVPVVENIRPGTTLHLGDGRKLAFGEKAAVAHALADLLIERKQAKAA